MLVRGIVVEDDLDGFAGRQLRLNAVEKADELLVPVALHVAADDGAVEYVERGKQCGRAVALIVVRHGSGPPLLQRQAGLRPVERLDLAFLIERQHDRIGWRRRIKPDDVAQFLDEFGVIRELELPDAVRVQPMGAPYPLHRTDADAHFFRHHQRCPMRRFPRRILERAGNNPLGRYLAFYNGRRPHSSLDRKTPDQAYFNLPLLAAA